MKKTKNIIIAIFAAATSLTMLSGCSCGGSNNPSAPTEAVLADNFMVTFRSFGPEFDVSDAQYKFGSIKEDDRSSPTSLTYNDNSGREVAQAELAAAPWGVTLGIDSGDKHIGEVHDVVSKSIAKTFKVFELFDAEGKKIAESDKVERSANDFSLHDNRGVIATLHRGARLDLFQWIDYVEVIVERPGIIDPNMFVMMAAFETGADHSD